MEFDDVVVESRFVLSADLVVERMGCHWSSRSRTGVPRIATNFVRMER
jgi:hypothetical protein